MSESVRDLLVRGIAAARAGEAAEALFFLEWALRLDPSPDQRLECLLWIGKTTSDPQKAQRCLEEILAYDPNHQPARRQLAILQGRLQPQQVVDPDRLPAPAPGLAPDLRQMICPRCGGRLVFSPDGAALICEFCQRHAPSARAPLSPASQDFTVAMATAAAHRLEAQPQQFACQSCGAAFLLLAGTLSVTCPYCGSPYVVEDHHLQLDHIPDGLISFAISLSRARQIAAAWAGDQGHTLPPRSIPLRALYLPVWYFEIALPPAAMERLGRSAQAFAMPGQWVGVPGFSAPAEAGAALPLHQLLLKSLDSYLPAALRAYDPAYLADWPAAPCTLPLADASLQARWRVLEVLGVNPSSGLRLTSMDLLVNNFRLALLPAWIGRLPLTSQPLPVLLNGHNGSLFSIE